jgi:membrane protease YdiL (CAAX protease family)
MLLLGCIAATLLPILYAPVSNPVATHWLLTKGQIPMTPEVYARAELVGKAIPFARELLVVISLLALSIMWGPRIDEIGWTIDSWKTDLGFGLLIGVGWLGIYLLLLVIIRPTKTQLQRHRLVSESAVYWVGLNGGAAVVEELWRGYCITTLNGSQVLGSSAAVFLSSVAFASAHTRSLSRMGATFLLGLVLGWLFVWSKSQWSTVGAHLTINLGTIWLVRWSHRVAKD